MKREKKRLELNLPLLIGTILLPAVAGPTIYFWHAHQLRQTAGALLSRAGVLEQEQQWLIAAEYVNRYLSLRPEDVDARVRVAEDYSKGADTPQRKSRAVDLYYRAIGVTKDAAQKEVVQSLRIGLTENLLSLGRFQSAVEQALQIDDDPTAMKLLALALYGQRRRGKLEPRDKAITAEQIEDEKWSYDKLASQAPVSLVVERALGLSDPPDLKLSVALASICRDNPDWLTDEQVKQFATPSEDGEPPGFSQKARRLMDQLCDGQPKDPDVLLAHFAFVVDDDPDAAEQDLKDALALEDALDMARDNESFNVDVHLAAADYYLAKGRDMAKAAEGENDAEAAVEFLELAKRHYEQLVEMEPALPAAHLGLGDALVALKQTDAAIAAWRNGLASIDDAAQSLELHLRLVDGLMAAEKLDDAEKALQAFEAAIQAVAPRATKAQLNAWGLASSRQKARLHMARKDYAQAVPLLERVIADSRRMPAGSKAEWLALLAASRAALNEWDSAATTYETAARLYSNEDDNEGGDGGDVGDRYREAAAAAWARAGRPAEAIRQFASITSRTPEGLIAYARALLQQQLARPRGDRNWDRFLLVQENLESLLETDAKVPQPWRIPLLRVDYQLALNSDESRDAALATLAELENAYDNEMELQRRLVFLYENLGEPRRAEAALARVVKVAPPYRVALLEAHLFSGREEFAKARKRLEAAIEKYPPKKYPAEAESLRVGLAQLKITQGAYEEAIRDLQSLDKQPDLARTRQLAELALKTMPSTRPGDGPAWVRWSADLEELEDRLRNLEGSEGANWRYYRARRLVALATSPDDAGLTEAARLQDFLQGSRPYWPATHVLKGMIDERRGRADEAIGGYAKAVDLGERQFSVYYRLLRLLLDTGRAAEAQRYLTRMEDYIPSSPELSDLTLEVFVQLNEIDRAVDMAAKAVRERPLDAMAHVLHGQMLLRRSLTKQARASDRAEAERVLKTACDIVKNKDVRPINGLFLYYLRTDQRDKARETLQRVEQISNLDESTRAFVLAQGYELLGEQELAEEQYRKAQRVAPDNALIPLRLARLYLQQDEGEKAEATLRRILQVDPAVRPARRMLAALLAARGGEEEWLEARKLLGPEVGEGGEVSHLDERLQAVLLARRRRPADIDAALEILTRLVERAAGTDPGDRVMLARACMIKYALPETDENTRQGLADTARRQYLAAVNAGQVDPNHVALFVDFLLDQDDLKTAEDWIAKLETLEPDAVRPLNLRARWLKARDRIADFAPLVKAWVARSQTATGEEPTEEELGALAQRYVQAGNVCSAIDAHAQAESWYRRAVELDQSAYKSLALSLARQPAREKTEEAIQLALREAGKAQDAASAIALASVLVTGRTEAADFAAAEAIFQKRMREEPDNPNLLQAIANVRYVERRLDEVERLYRRVVALRPRDAVAHNNLATVLSEQEDKQQEAIAYLQRGIETAGEQPFLLDTKGIILLNQNRVAEAVAVLSRAATDDDPRFLLHLVMALDRHGEEEEARRLWRRLDHDRLNHSILSSEDVQARDRLASRYGTGEAS